MTNSMSISVSMLTRGLPILFAIAFVFTCHPPSGAAIESEESGEVKSLRGLTKFSLFVENPGKDSQAMGLSDIDLYKWGELRLRKEGLWKLGKADAFIQIALTSMKTPCGFSAFVQISILQSVTLKRNGNIALHVIPTWSKEHLIAGSPGDLKAYSREIVNDMFDELLLDFYKANPVKKK